MLCYSFHMITGEKWREWENEILKANDLDTEQKFKLLEGMLEEAKALGAFSSENALDGIEVSIRIAKAVNSVSKAA